MRLAAFAAAFALLGLVGCASEINYERYSLTLDINPQIYAESAVSRIEVLPSLPVLSGGMLMKTSEVEIVESTNFRYARPLSEDLKALFADELLKQGLEDEEYFYTLKVSRFWGTVDGKAETALTLSIYKDKKAAPLFSKSAMREVPLTADGYRELALRLKEGFSALCAELIADFSQKKQ